MCVLVVKVGYKSGKKVVTNQILRAGGLMVADLSGFLFRILVKKDEI